ncbi:MAG: serine/threonine protein kinase [Acidobacteria bacterium]|nr:serine/threonine protein kinase [Acidobacteriota bacterium]
MQARQWDKIKAIFAEAAALDSERRGAYLDEACKDDPGLRSEVDRLLGHHQDSATTEIFDQARRHSLQPNEVLGGRFRILRFLGRGGMGEVYGAEDLELGGSVALKVLRPEFLDDPQFLGRFRREVQLARQVSHPNVCRIFDVGHDYSTGRERVFFTMEFLEGETLAACLRRAGRLSEPAALPLVSQIADGLAALHERGIVHRDLKPGNVMLVQGASGSTRAVVSDLGLARATIDASGRDALSRPGNVFGTVDYMAPEQLMGKDVSPATDLYAFGLVMYEMVTGVRPFPGGQGLENAVRRLTEPPEPPRKHVADLSPEWEAIILRCLEKEPANRPESADEVVRGLMGSSQFRRLHAPVISRGGKSKWGCLVRGNCGGVGAFVPGSALYMAARRKSSGPPAPRGAPADGARGGGRSSGVCGRIDGYDHQAAVSI